MSENIVLPANTSTSPVISCSVRKRKASTPDRSNKTTKTQSDDHLSKSAPYHHVVSSWSPVRKEMIRPIKSLDEMLISSYRASLSHHNYAAQAESNKSDAQVKNTSEDIVFTDEAENAQLSLKEISISGKSQLPKEEKALGKRKPEENKSSYDEMIDQGTPIPVCKFYQRKRIPTILAHSSRKNNNDARWSQTPTKQVFQRSGTNGKSQSEVAQSTSGLKPLTSGYNRTRKICSCRRAMYPNAQSNITKANQERRSFRYPAKTTLSLPASYLGTNKVPYKGANAVQEDGLIINTNVNDLSTYSKKMTCVQRAHTPPTEPSYIWHKAKRAMDNISLNLPQRLENLYYAQKMHSPDFTLFPIKSNKVKLNWTKVWDLKNLTLRQDDFGIYDLTSKALVIDEEIQPPLKREVRRRMLQSRSAGFAPTKQFASKWSF